MVIMRVVVVALALIGTTTQANSFSGRINMTPIVVSSAEVICNSTEARVKEFKLKLVALERRMTTLQRILVEKMSAIGEIVNSTRVKEEICRIEARASGYDDNPRTPAYVKMNGRVTNGRGRGITLVTVTRDCKAGEVTRYDTYGSAQAAVSLKDYLQALPPHAHVVGISYDSFGSKLAVAKPILAKYGVDLSKTAVRTSLVFAFIKGQPINTAQRTAERHRGPADLLIPDFQ